MNFTLPSRARRPGAHPVSLVSASEALRQRWDHDIQPIIDSAGPRRQDFNWRWSRAGALLAGRLFPPPSDTGGLPLPAVEGLASIAEWWADLAVQQPNVLALATGGGVPLAMALVCDAYVDDAHFVWMLTGLPRESLGAFFGDDEDEWPGLITLGMVWALVQRALQNKHGQEPKGLLLHVDDNGGQLPVDWYRAAGMDRLPSDVLLSHARRTDGRFLLFSPQEAQAFFSQYRGAFR